MANRKRRSKWARDYRAEYEARIAKGSAEGKSRSQSRGHARAGERPKPAEPRLADPNRAEERAIKAMTTVANLSLKEAARTFRVPEQRLRRYLKENFEAKRSGRGWQIADTRPRQVPLYSEGALAAPWLSPAEASRAGSYMGAVNGFLRNGNEDVLAAFDGEGVRDIAGKRLAFETDPNILYELDQAGELSFPDIYRIVS